MQSWISSDFPLLSEAERREYDLLRQTAQWVCICCSRPVRQSKVKFGSAVKVHEIDKDDPEAYKEARDNVFMKAKMMFQVDIMRAEQMLAPFLSVAHRENVYIKNRKLLPPC